MHMVWTLTRKEWQLLRRERGVVFWLVLLPILFMLVFGSVFGRSGQSKITVPVADLDRTAASRTFIAELARDGGFRVSAVPASEVAGAKERMAAGKQSLLVVVPRGFGAAADGSGPPVAVTVYRDATSQVTTGVLAAIEAEVGRYRNGRIAAELAARGLTRPQVAALLAGPVGVADRPVNARGFDILGQIVPGYTVMFAFYAIISLGRRLLRDRESGMTARMMVSGLTPWRYLAGVWLPYGLVVVVQCAVLLGFGRAVFGVHLGNAPALVLIVLALALCVSSIGMALSMWVKSENQVNAWTQLLSLGGAVLGGLWFPPDLMPGFLQTAGRLTPQYWAQQALQTVMVRGGHLANILFPLGVLLAFSAAAFAVAMWGFPRYLRSSFR
ncbi:MAG: ABC transporter permease [Alicyclobacillaceae bacterium]|nr:ABC transporter permease [Alicyclobacillaceae bacterium]